MCAKLFKIANELDLNNIETQLALQCAPVIAGLKPSNLLIVSNSNALEAIRILSKSDISYSILYRDGEKTTVFLYCRKALMFYVAQPGVRGMFEEYGYPELSFDGLLRFFRQRYIAYRRQQSEFPHEMGLFLGYPIEDVKGFMEQNGQNSLYSGYWKVYQNLPKKLSIFQGYDDARYSLVHRLSNGSSFRTILDSYAHARKGFSQKAGAFL